MRTIKLSSILIAVILLILGSCSKDGSMPDDTTFPMLKSGTIGIYQLLDNPPLTVCGTETHTLLAGQTINVGTVTVSNNAEYLYVTYTATSPWMLKETHLYVGTKEGVPMNNQGVPVPGKFPYSNSYSPYRNQVTYQIPTSALPDCFVIYSHAVVAKQSSSGEVTQTGWAGDHHFNTARWGLYFDYCNQKCEQPPLVVAFKSLTPDGYVTCGAFNDAYPFVLGGKYKLYYGGVMSTSNEVGYLTIKDSDADGKWEVLVDNSINSSILFVGPYLFIGSAADLNNLYYYEFPYPNPKISIYPPVSSWEFELP